MQIFLDDFSGYGNKKDHLEYLQKCLEECRLNGEKNAFCVNLGILLRHSVSWWSVGRSTKDYSNYCYASTYQCNDLLIPQVRLLVINILLYPLTTPLSG